MKILITGSSSGVGYGLTKFYLEQGHEVFGISRSKNGELEEYNNFRFLLQDISEADKLHQNLYNFLKDEDILDLVVLGYS